MENFYKKIEDIIKKDKRYKPDAYEFVMQALWFTQKKLSKHGHVSGRELLEGIKDFILEQYGPMTKAVLQHWGVETTDDFGQIVFNMIEYGLLNKTKEDSLEDFKNVYNFEEVFDIFRNNSFHKFAATSKRSPLNQKPKVSIVKLSSPENNFGSKNFN